MRRNKVLANLVGRCTAPESLTFHDVEPRTIVGGDDKNVRNETGQDILVGSSLKKL